MEAVGGIDNDNKISQDEIKTLQELSKLNETKLKEKIGDGNLLKLKSILESEKESYLNRSKNEKSKKMIGAMIDKIVLKIEPDGGLEEEQGTGQEQVSGQVLEVNDDIKTLKEVKEMYEGRGKEVSDFLNDVFGNKLEDSLSIFNEKEFSSIDNKKGFSEYELEQFKLKIDKAIERMGLLKSYDEFKKAHENATDYSLGWSNADKFYAKRIDMNNFYIPGLGNTNVSDVIFDYVNEKIGDGVDISEEELKEMRDKEFDITSIDSMKDFFVVLGVEIGEGLQDIVKMILNIGAGIALSARYIGNKIEIEGGVDTSEEARLIIENERMLEENPSLAIIELIENGAEILEQIWEKMKSGTNEAVALGITSIVGLLAGGTGVVKVLGTGVKMTGKGTKVGKIGAQVEKAAGKVAYKLDKIDDTITTGGLNKLFPNSKIEDSSVDIIHTDAEGRLVLADGISDISKNYDLDKIETGKILEVKTQNSIYIFEKLENGDFKIISGTNNIVNNIIGQEHKIIIQENGTILFGGLRTSKVDGVNVKNKEDYTQESDILKEEKLLDFSKNMDDVSLNFLNLGELASFIKGIPDHLKIDFNKNILVPLSKIKDFNSNQIDKFINYIKEFNSKLGDNYNNIKDMLSSLIDKLANYKKLNYNKLDKIETGKILEVKTQNSIYIFEKLENGDFKIISGTNNIVNNIIGQEHKIIIQENGTILFGGLRTSKVDGVNVKNKEDYPKENNIGKEKKGSPSNLLNNISIDKPANYKKLNYNKLDKIETGKILEVKTQNSIYIFEKLENGDFKIISGTNNIVNNIIGQEHKIIIQENGTILFGGLRTSKVDGINVKNKEDYPKESNIGKEKKESPSNLLNNISEEKLLDFSENMDNISLNFLNLGEKFKPKYSTIIDGKEFLLTSKFSGGKDMVVGYVKKGDLYEPRLFYFSSSGGNWHSSPGVDGQRLSKGDNAWNLSYEKGTVINEKLFNVIDNLPTENKNFSSYDLYKSGFTVDRYQKKSELNVGEVKDYRIRQDKLNEKHPYISAEPISFANYKDSGMTFLETKKMFEGLDTGGISLNFRKSNKEPSIVTHEHLGDVVMNTIETTLDGKNVEIIFANSVGNNPDLIWIENIVFKDSKVNSYGFNSETVNGGLLTTKPLEYTIQTSDKLWGDLEKYGEIDNDIGLPVYSDIRGVIQGNPLIEAYKDFKNNNLSEAV